MRRHYRGISINTSENTHETVFELLEKDPNHTVLDIPAGSGAFVQRLKDAGFKHVRAVDIENILEIAHDDFTVGDMTQRLPVADSSCDAVVCIDGIEHIARQFDFVREVNRILKEGGEFIVSTPNISSLRSRWRWFLTGHHHKCPAPLDEHNPTPLHHVGMVSFPEMQYLLHTSGFAVTQVATNRIKPVSWLYALVWPLAQAATRWTYRKEGKRQGTRAVNRRVFRTVFSTPVLFGETLIVKAVKSTSAASA